jgi:hypothetical protein
VERGVAMMSSGLQPSASASLVRIRQLVARYLAFTKGLYAFIARARIAARILISERQFQVAFGLVSTASPTAVAESVATQMGIADRQRMTAVPAGNREVAMKEAEEGICVNCEKKRELKKQSIFVLDNESKERALVGEVISTVALAGQICREFSVSDHGIDMEIEFKADAGEATGRKVYLQLKSGDSYLSKRKKDGAEIFKIKDERHARYWMEQAFPVLLVIRSSKGQVRWMEVRDWLKRESYNSKKPVKQIVFEGERFDVMSVRRWRERALGR